MPVDGVGRHLRLWSVLVIVGVFLAGAIAGAGILAWLRPPAHKWRPLHRDLPALFSELQLTPDQRDQATAIFDKHRTEVESIIKANFPRVRAAQEQSNRELRAILTDGQKKKLDEIEARPRPGKRWGVIGGGPERGATVSSFAPDAGTGEAGGDRPAANPAR